MPSLPFGGCGIDAVRPGGCRGGSRSSHVVRHDPPGGTPAEPSVDVAPATDCRPAAGPRRPAGPGWSCAQPGTTANTSSRPVTGEYFQLGPEESFLLSLFDGRRPADEIRAAFLGRFGDALGEEDLDQFLDLARSQGLLLSADQPATAACERPPNCPAPVVSRATGPAADPLVAARASSTGGGGCSTPTGC